MAWLALSLAALVQAAPPAAPAPAAQAPATRPAPRPRPPRPEDRIWRLFFAWDNARVTGEGLSVLDQAADDYHRNGRASVEIAAGSDESGRNAYNQRLSARRARAVADGLVQRGVPRGVIRLRPLGIHRPLVATGNGIREPMNRYAEISFPAPVLR
jgi:OOP family OmpA-OmpF porin